MAKEKSDKKTAKAQAKLDRSLYDAVKKGKVEEAQRLLEMGADPEAPVGRKGRNSFSRAAEKPERGLEEVLAKRGASSLSRSQNSAAPDDAPPSDDDDDNSSSGTARKSESGFSYIEIERSEPRSLEARAGSRMSILAEGGKQSLRRKTKRGADSIVEEAPVYNDAAEEGGDWNVHKSEEADPGMPLPRGDKNWEFPRDKVKQLKKLGQGHFGVVFEGEAEGLVPGEKTTRVAVKMLSEESEEAVADFHKEADIMMAIDGSDKIVRLLGICTEDKPFLMMMELMSRGDLKTVLRDSRAKSSKPSPFSLKQLYEMGADIAEGMAYLTKVKIVHRDLAARNCLVNDELQVKIGDFGLTRDVYAGEYYRMTGSNPLPVRWMAPEAIGDGMYTTYSDIWSFGIVLWEIITFAKMPYAGLSNMEVVERVCEDDYRLPQPKECPDELYSIMLQCWNDDHTARTPFSKLHAQLVKFAKAASSELISKNKRSQERLQLPAGGEADSSAPVSPMSPAAKVEEEPTYTPRAEIDEDDSQVLYRDDRYAGLSNIEQAIKSNEARNAINDVTVAVGDEQKRDIVHRSVEEHVDDDEEPASPVSKAREKFAAATSTSAAATPRPSQPTSQGSSPKSKPKYGGASSWVTSKPDTAKPTLNTARPTSRSTPSPQPAAAEAKPKPKYGGATSWVTAGSGPSTHMHVMSMLDSRKKPAPEPMNRGQHTGLSKPVPMQEQGTLRAVSPSGPTDAAAAVLAAADQADDTATRTRRTSNPTSPAAQENFHFSRDHLANDSSDTARKAQEARSAIKTQAIKDMEDWIESVIGDYLQGDSLQERLKSGVVLCTIMDKMKPGCIAKIHKSPLAFKQMENIGYFLDAAREYGLRDSDLFITVDLFEAQNMDQVVICLSALKKLAEARGFRV